MENRVVELGNSVDVALDATVAKGGDVLRYSPDRFLRILDDSFYQLLTNVQDLVMRTTTRFWAERQVRFLHVPMTTGSVSSPMGHGSDSVPVKATILGSTTHLVDSMQFMLEYGCRLAPAGAWYLMPSYRGEKADETHLNQFFHSEAELPCDLDGVIGVVEDYLRSLGQAVLTEVGDDMAAEGRSTDHVRDLVELGRFPRMTMDEAVAHLGDDPASVRYLAGGAPTLSRHGERRLMAEVAPVLWVTHHYHATVPFYQAFDDDRKLARNADLLMGPGETVGLGERHRTGAQVAEALQLHEVNPVHYDWYIRLKNASPMLTSGFGLGVERWLMWLLGVDDIRDLQLAVREWGREIYP